MTQASSSSGKIVKQPGPDHPISIEPGTQRVVVKMAGRIVADTRDALVLKEANYPPVHYLPRKDVDMALLERTEHATYCPYKGECSYYSIAAAGERGANVVWSYEHPYEAVAAIRDHLAFYPNRVDAIELLDR
ncbi:DUF427 domain-containing protein [Dyella acidiphila]|uniref:DUF427 domain-containing protein n=1 Tax=Dyella acidiphila TaxID=2775866 RepID=A0ABR9GD22_9GAMM|nr:DUF427 domain-containing protein [Dyella acidiphila]MBE1161932.1 DUF427 domain-containing protein [Dyella acidiphila]